MAKLDVFWSLTREDQYIVFGSEINLYRIESLKDDAEHQGAKLSDSTYGQLLSQNTENQFPKCMAWYPKIERDYIVAVAQANGKIVLSSLDPKKNDDLIGREFYPKHSRPCFCVAWSRQENPKLAAGLDKYRSDTSLLIWDVNTSRQDWSSNAGSSTEPSSATRPLTEHGNSEATYSIAWMNADTIVTGMNKYIRVLDLREASKVPLITQTKAVFGVCIDVLCEYQVASFVENQVFVWDMRNFEKARFMLPAQRTNIVKIGWCPKRSGLLACLCKDSQVIKVFDIQHVTAGLDDVEPNFNDRIVTAGNHTLSSFDWNPFDENRLLTINDKGHVNDIRLCERINLDLNPCDGSDQQIVFSNGRKFQTAVFDNRDDISCVMQRRALMLYGLKKDLHRDILKIVQDDIKLQYLWKWILHMRYLSAREGFIQPSVDSFERTRLIGLVSILEDARFTNSSSLHWIGTDSRNILPLTVYVSPERAKCLKICKWPTSALELKDITQSLESLGQFEKATAVAIFHGDVAEAVDILKRGSQSGQGGDINHFVAMALSGINNTKNSPWLVQCRDLRSRITEPYLRAAFTFLTCGDDFKDILNERDVSIPDRVAFACMFLSETKLKDFILKLQQEVKQNGDLEGILLTGLESAGVDLLQQYVENTGDIQTACLAMIHSYPSALSNDSRVTCWIEHFRNLLDKWKLWIIRAQFDIFYQECLGPPPALVQGPIPQTSASQIYLSCTFCSKPVIANQIQQRRQYMHSGTNQRQIKVTVCQECRKPLPRCALCLKHMGTASGVFGTNKSESGGSIHDAQDNKVSDFGSWFMWCQTCHHGGHAAHLEEWFASNVECPVSACTCKCASMDSIPSLKQLTVGS